MREAARASALLGSCCATTTVKGFMRTTFRGTPGSTWAGRRRLQWQGSLQAVKVRSLLVRLDLLCHFEGLRLELSVLLQQDLDLALGRLQFLATGIGKLDAFFEEFQRRFE